MQLFSTKNLENKLGIFHWNIGFIESSIDDIINNISFQPVIHWLKHPYHDRFFADPFILKVTDEKIEVLVEEFFYAKWKGEISLLTISRRDYRLIHRKTLLKLDTHLSFPFIYEENDQTYIIPENSQSGSLFIYTYNQKYQKLEFPQKLIQAPVVDPVVTKLNNTYFLLCTSLNFDQDADLLIYYSDNLFGPYIPFFDNPVKQDITSARSGGGLYIYNDHLYRCTQNSFKSYGASLYICQIKSIDKNKFKEEKSINILPDTQYRHGLHTLNYKENICVVDGLKYIFKPLVKIKRKLSVIK